MLSIDNTHIYKSRVSPALRHAWFLQLQLDVYGELMDAIYQARTDALAPVESAWAQQQTLIEHLEQIWEQPDDGIWEVRGGRRHFTSASRPTSLRSDSRRSNRAEASASRFCSV